MKKVYASIIDQFLDSNEPEYTGLESGKSNGDSIKAITKELSDMDFLESIAGESHHTVVPSGSGITANEEDWRNRSAKALNDESVLNAALIAAEDGNIDGLEKKSLSDKEVKAKIDGMLHLGYAPVKIAKAMEKLAELTLFNRQFAADYLDGRAGNIGLAYIEPNHFMKHSGSKGCVETFNRIKKDGKLKAASVQKISACATCSHCSGGRCNLYKLPIVASKNELMTVASKVASSNGLNLTKGNMKKIHNGEMSDPKVEPKTARVETPVVIRSAGDKMSSTYETVTSNDIKEAIERGKTFEQTFVEARAKAGSMLAKKASAAYIDSLKKTASKINLDRVDCKYLKGKLASCNAIVGGSKCATCSYRNGMHCGLTGGTLLTFPGMDKVKSNKIASGNQDFDGNTLNAQVGLDSTKIQNLDIEIEEKKGEDLDLGSVGYVGDIE